MKIAPEVCDASDGVGGGGAAPNIENKGSEEKSKISPPNRARGGGRVVVVFSLQLWRELLLGSAAHLA
jgi:hypothetical protein